MYLNEVEENKHVTSILVSLSTNGRIFHLHFIAKLQFCTNIIMWW